jgi:hypothetical protein
VLEIGPVFMAESEGGEAPSVLRGAAPQAAGDKLMSIDYPDYLRIRERSRPLGWLWMVGDRGHYLGLLGAVLALELAVVESLARLAGLGPQAGIFDPARWSLPALWLAVPAGVLLLLGAGYLKGLAHRPSGIHAEVSNGDGS